MGKAARRLAVGLAAAAVLVHIAYPVASGQPQVILTALAVVIFFLASVTHALATRGPAWTAALVAVTAGGGLLAEAAGVATGLPFGSYAYANSLGFRVLGVPLVVPLAWTMMAYPAYVTAARLVSGRITRGLLAGYALASWDLFLDPQMVDAGHWRWEHPRPALPGVPDVPLTNYLGWLAVATAMGLLLGYAQRAPVTGPDGVPLALYLWTYFSSVLAHAVFFGLAGSAAWGGVAMGLVAVPLAVSLLTRRAARTQP